MSIRATGILFRTMLAIPFIAVLILLLAVGYNFAIEPSHQAVTSAAWNGAEQAFGAQQEADARDAIMEFAAVAGTALVLVVCAWWIVGDLRNDVRQRRRPPL